MTPNPKRILLVEDNRADAVLLQEMLMRDAPGQFDLCWVSSLRETLDRIERERFDAILLDLSLPDSHGLDTITRLCSAVPAMPILVITGVTDEQIANEAVRCGAADYLVKGHTEARSMVRAIRYAIDRKRAEEALQRAKTAAEEANQAKSRFLANVSHELRTPMNAILGMVELASHKVTDPTARDFLHTVKESADLLLTLLNDLLDCAKIEAGKLELESAPFSLPSIMDQVSRVLAVRASEKGLAFSCRIPPATPDSLVGDAVRLRQVLFNLAGNAVKFTERGEVEVSVRVAEEGNKGLGIGDWGLGEDKQPITADSPNLIPNPQSLIPPTPPSVTLEFSVRDTGIGIPPADLERIFQPFAQADASTTRRFGGTGLGLSICSNLVALMGGRIWVQSDVGQGSTFYFTVRLPVAREFCPRPETAPELSAVAASALRILLAEDNPANQKLAAYILQDRGHAIEIAADGQQAIRMAEENRYDVILMDVQMPGTGGLEATKAIRAREQDGRRVPIIAMTAHVLKGDREQCLAAGMDAYLSKPIDGHEMISLVESLAKEGRGIRDWGLEEGNQPTTADSPNLIPNPQSLIPSSPQFLIPPSPPIFDAKLALERCFHQPEMVRDMIRCFFSEVDNLFPQMRTALEKGDLPEVGRLGHRLKGTVVYLGAEPARAAAFAVENFETQGGEPAEAVEAVNRLAQQCQLLKAALAEHRRPAAE